MSEGNCTHRVDVDKNIDGIPVVKVYNDNDEYYVEIFTSHADVEEFIQRLRVASNEAFGVE